MVEEKARRAMVQLGQYEMEGFMLPDGSYAMSQTQAAEAVGLSERSARDFLRSKTLKRLMGDDYTPAISDIEPGQAPKERGCDSLELAGLGKQR